MQRSDEKEEIHFKLDIVWNEPSQEEVEKLWNAHPQRDAVENYHPRETLRTGLPRTKGTPDMKGNGVWTP